MCYSFTRAGLEKFGRIFSQCFMSSCSYLERLVHVSGSYHRDRDLLLENEGRRRENRREKENGKCCSVSVSFSVQSGGRTGMREDVIRVNAKITVSVDHGCGSRG